MPHAIQIPRLGWSMEQGTFVGWLKQNGEPIKPGDALFTLEGEKAIQEIEAVDAGTLHFDPTFPQEGDVVSVGAVIGYLLVAGETAPPIQRPTSPLVALAEHGTGGGGQSQETPPVQSPQSRSPVLRSKAEDRAISAPPAASPAVRRLARQLGVDLSQMNSAGRISEADVCRRYLQNRGELTAIPSARNSTEQPDVSAPATAERVDVPRRRRDLPAISPRAAQTAQRLGIDWTRLSGTGATGRIRERDVFTAATQPSAAVSLAALADDFASPRRTIRISSLRRTIANRMVASRQQTAPVTLTTEIDVTAIIDFRTQRKRSGADPIPSITDCFVKLVATALPEHPLLNARWRDEAIDLFDEIHIGIAVETDDGLLVPVVRDAHRQSVFEIARQSRALIEKARARQLTAHDLQGSTFTITNLGTLGIDAFTPIIHYPEVAILGLGRIRPSSLADAGSASHRMTLSLTFDHRVLDGAPAARFLQTLTRLAGADPQSLFEPASHR